MCLQPVDAEVGEGCNAVGHSIGIKVDGRVVCTVDVAVLGCACAQSHDDSGNIFGNPGIVFRTEGQGLSSGVVVVAADLFDPGLNLTSQFDIVDKR